MNSSDIIRAAIPEADDGLCEHILWGRTPFPCGKVTARSIYQAASAYKRAANNNLNLCDFCHRVAIKNDLCESCRTALTIMRSK